MNERIHVGVYGEVNANLLDGSSAWLQSICLTLATIPDARVTVLLRAPLERDLLIRPLVEHPKIEVVEPRRGNAVALLTPSDAVGALEELDRKDRFDRLLLRGASVSDEAVKGGRFDGRLWLYHVPVDGSSSPPKIARQGAVAHRILCQTTAIRDAVRAAAPALSSRLLLLPPMIPPAGAAPDRGRGPIERILYAGKLSPEYFCMEMVELLRRVRGELPKLELHVAGDKVHNPPDDPSFRERARQALSETDGLIWHGALTREEVGELSRSADVALSLRHPSLDDSVEMSTKVLEYGASACPVLLNANPLHARLLGPDYPLMAAGLQDATSKLLAASRRPELRDEAGRRVRELSQRHSFERVAATLAPHLHGIGAAAPERPATASGTRPPRLLVAGHNFAFVEPIASRTLRDGAELREDRWETHTGKDRDASLEAISWADVVLCEWCLDNAVWYSRHKRPEQSLIVRFHRMELETRYPAEVDLEQVDAMVFVADHVLEAACERFGWAVDDPRFRVVPNAVETERLRLAKLPGAEFNLGMVGYVPWIKRLDRVLEILERVRAEDDRFRLIVKGRGPWEYPWMSKRERERDAYEAAYRRIERSPRLRQAVVFEPFGDDIPEFLRQVGWIVSSSEIEGHSVALAEGMASGAVPVVIDRPGAAAQYEQRWIHADAEAAAGAILATQASGMGPDERRAAASFAERWSWERLGSVWDELLGLAPRGDGKAAAVPLRR